MSITVKHGSAILIDAAALLLSLANQLAITGKVVEFIFEAGESGAMGYLNRLGFFDGLDLEVAVTPPRPTWSGAQLFGGNNSGLVELQPIVISNFNRQLIGTLADGLTLSYKSRPDYAKLNTATSTVFSELIQNIHYHSNSPIDGYAAYQKYARSKSAVVAVSDSGDGVLETLRPSLIGTKEARLGDPDLLVHMFNCGGLSSKGEGRGAGLYMSGMHALKYKARLSVRLRSSRLTLVPDLQHLDQYGQVRYGLAEGRTGLAEIWGTHISFRFFLDR